MIAEKKKSLKRLEIVYIVPSRYDDDGYVKRYRWGVVPSNSLAVLRSLTESLIAEQPYPGVDIHVTAYDDNVEKIPVHKIVRLNRRSDTKVVVGLVGVQSGQFPRASEIALEFKKQGVDAMVGGFHVSGVLALFDELTPELQTLVDAGVSLIAGESETPGVLRSLFHDVLDGTLQPIYRFPKAPDIQDAPLPQVDPQYVDHFGARWATIDSSRGCPYGCSFCTVINIQGRKMRCRNAQAVLTTVKSNCDKGVSNFFFTDDNFARSKIWPEVFDGLIEMRRDGIEVGFMMQVDTQSSKIPNFVEKAKAAGCRSVFIGMESVNPANIEAAGKSQNSVDQYRDMVQVWQNESVIVHVGYIIGLPHDTPESVQSDIQFLRDHVGVDLVSFFMLTPLPGSKDHFEMIQSGAAIDPDLNKYDSFHETFEHANMPGGKWVEATQAAYREFYTKEHCATILRRVPKEHYWFMFWNLIWYRYSGVLSGTHPMMTGFFRVKNRWERRPGLPKENLFHFTARWIRDFVLDAGSYIKLFFEFQEIWFLTREKQRSARKSKFWGLPTLAGLRSNWSGIQQRIAQYNWSGRYDAAALEVRNALATTAQTLQGIGERFRGKNTRQARQIEQVVSEIEEQITKIEENPGDTSILQQSQAFVREKLIGRYEEVTHKYVKARRRINDWRRRAFLRLKKGKMLGLTGSLFRAPVFAVLETYLSLRFGIAAIRKEI